MSFLIIADEEAIVLCGKLLTMLYAPYSLPLEQLVPTVMSLFQDQPDLLMGFKDFLPEAQNLMNRLVPVCCFRCYFGHEPLETKDSSIPCSHAFFSTYLAYDVLGLQTTTLATGNTTITYGYFVMETNL